MNTTQSADPVLGQIRPLGVLSNIAYLCLFFGLQARVAWMVIVKKSQEGSKDIIIMPHLLWKLLTLNCFHTQSNLHPIPGNISDPQIASKEFNGHLLN